MDTYSFKKQDVHELIKYCAQNDRNDLVLQIMNLIDGKSFEVERETKTEVIITPLNFSNKKTQKLNLEIARQIRKEYPNRNSNMKEFAKKFGVAPGAVYNIITNKTYKESNAQR